MRVVTWEEQAQLSSRDDLTGMERLRRVVAEELPQPSVASLLGWERPFEFDHGRAVVSVRPEEHHYSPLGIVHGGVALSLLDTAMAIAAHSTLEAGESCSTVQIKASFQRVIVRDVGLVRCSATVVQRDGDLIEAEGAITNEHGRSYASGTGICRVRPR